MSIPTVSKEFQNILKACTPSLDLYVNKYGQVSKRSYFSKVLYYFGYNKKQSDFQLKQRIGEIVKKVMKGVGEASWRKTEMGRFLKKLGKLKSTQFDRREFQSLMHGDCQKSALANYIEEKFHLIGKKEIKEMFVSLLKKAKQLDDPKEIYEHVQLNYEKVDAEINKQLKTKKDCALVALQACHLEKNKLTSNENLTKEQFLDLIQFDVLEAKTLSKISKMNFLFQLGVNGTSKKGVTGTILVKDLKNRVLGVFKPDAAYAPLATKIKNLFKRIGGQLSLLSNKKFAQSRSEYVSYRADRFFNIKSVPSSKLTVLGGVKGVFQLAAGTAKKTRDLEVESSTKISKRLKEAKEVKTILNKSSFTVSELEFFQRFIILDFLIGNLDAHAENWFIDLKEDKITGIVGIDKANSWLKKNPRVDDFRSHNQYKWREFSISNHPFTTSMRQFMSTITEERMLEFIKEVNHDFSGFFDKDIKKLAMERAKAIRMMADKVNSTPGNLSKIIADSNFRTTLGCVKMTSIAKLFF